MWIHFIQIYSLIWCNEMFLHLIRTISFFFSVLKYCHNVFVVCLILKTESKILIMLDKTPHINEGTVTVQIIFSSNNATRHATNNVVNHAVGFPPLFIRSAVFLGQSCCRPFVFCSSWRKPKCQAVLECEHCKKGNYLHCWGEGDRMGRIWHLQRSRQNARSRYCYRMGERRTDILQGK